MLTTLAVLVVTLSPILAVVALLEVATWRDRRRRAAIARQITLTDAIAGELGAVVAPVVTKPLWGPWQIRIAVPFTRPATVGSIIAIAHRVLAFAERMSPGDYHIVLTPQEEPARGPRSTVVSRACAEAA
ncbi:MAG TPA: hypothetical protein VGX21_03715 [Methylomirabilota bacterium]|nr:hypothetical protein [Methylomirabilota bacterium]